MSLPPITQEWVDGLPAALSYLRVDLRGLAEHTQFPGSPVTIHCADGTVYRTRKGRLYKLAKEARLLRALSDTTENSKGTLEEVLERFVRAAQAKGTLTNASEDVSMPDDPEEASVPDVPEVPLDAIAPAQSMAPLPTPPESDIHHSTELDTVPPPLSDTVCVPSAPDAAHVALAGLADSMANEFVDALAQHVNAAIHARFAARRHEIIAAACHGLLGSAVAEDSVVSTPTHRAASALTASSVSA